jgi:hypothetical protein
MTSERSRAYGRVVATLRNLGPAKLWPEEQACIRDAADALLFCRHIAPGSPVAAAIADVAALVDHLVDSERWRAERARGLFDDIWDCGPLAGRSAVALPFAA